MVSTRHATRLLELRNALDFLERTVDKIVLERRAILLRRLTHPFILNSQPLSAQYNTVEEQVFLDEIGQEISSKCIAVISRLTTRRNEICSVSRLPLELLRSILLFSGFGLDDPQLHFQNLAWVSRTWRNLLINDAVFWTTIKDVWPQKFIDTVLERSKTAELCLHICYLGSKMGRLLEDQRCRIKSIYFLCTFVAERHQSYFTASYPSLQHLSLPVGGTRGDQYDFISLPVVPFSRDACLKRLEISIMVSWSALSLTLQNVSVLKIMFQSHETFALFFKNAATLVNLEELDFSLNNSTISSYLPPASPLPTFPNLRTLMIHQLNGPVLSSIPLFLPKLRLLWSDNREDVLDLDLSVEWPRDTLWPIHQYFDYASIRYLSITLDNKFGQNLRIVGSEIYDDTYSTYDCTSSSVIPAREGMGKRFEFSLDVLGDPAFGVLPYMCTVLKKMFNLLEIVVELRFSELQTSFESTRLHHLIDSEEVGYDEILIGLEESVDLLEESVYLIKILEVLQQDSICVCLESISLNYDPQRYLRHSDDFDKKGNVAGGGPMVDLLLNVLNARRNVLKHLFLENWLPLSETHLSQLKSWGTEVVEYPRII